MATEQVPAHTPERQAFYEKIAPANLAPLWENLHRMVTPAPAPSAVPAIWHYREVRPHLMASGGLTHFVIDEDLDRTVMSAMQNGDEKALASLPENLFKVGTAEIKNWYPVIAAMNAAGLKYRQVDYVPCYRSEAGTGNAMCFAYWE